MVAVCVRIRNNFWHNFLSIFKTKFVKIKYLAIGFICVYLLHKQNVFNKNIKSAIRSKALFLAQNPTNAYFWSTFGFYCVLCGEFEYIYMDYINYKFV